MTNTKDGSEAHGSLRDQAFANILQSASRQFRDSQADLELRPDRSLVSFYTGLELTLKARLFSEHWALLLHDTGSFSLSDLVAGAGKTIGLDGCLQRLTTAAGIHFSRQEKTCYGAVRNHRSRIVHFFHDAHSPGAKADARLKVLVEQWRAWIYIRNRVLNDWASAFASVLEDFKVVDSKLRSNRSYLDARYQDVKSEVESRRKGGTEIVVCRTCEFDAAQVNVDDSRHPCFVSVCQVCETTNEHLRTTCPDCSGDITIDIGLVGTCSACNYTPDPSIAYHVTEQARGYALSPKDSLDEPEIACAECGLPSVATIDGDLLCCNCLTWGERCSSCSYCGQYVMDWDSEGSFLTGCCMCEGRGFDD